MLLLSISVLAWLFSAFDVFSSYVPPALCGDQAKG
jgi:hypothetical protein